MSKLKNERYFAAGLTGAIFALYAASTFAYFSSNEGMKITDSNLQGDMHTHVAMPHNGRAQVADNKQLIKIMGKTQSHGIFSPLGNDVVKIPGVGCNITEQNLDFTYNFRDVPENCIVVLDED